MTVVSIADADVVAGLILLGGIARDAVVDAP